jgi:iron-sulfur cluster insertion protein
MSQERFTVSDAAQARIAHLLADEADGARLRVSVLGGGCSGFQYHFDFDTSFTDGDDALFGDARHVVVDETSLELLQGSQLDYVERLGASAFEITNPNADASCGCGNSFSVAI